MAEAFSRSLRSIEAEGAGRWPWLAAGALAVFALWGAWMLQAEVPLFATSADARLVRERAVFPLESGVDGRVVAVRVGLEQAVAAGDVLIELDASGERNALALERGRLESLEAQIALARAAVGALEASRAEAAQASESAAREAQVELAQRELAQRIAAEEAERLVLLHGEGGVAELTVSKARAEAEMAAASVQAKRIAIERMPFEQRLADGDRAAELAERRLALAETEGRAAATALEIERLELDLERRSVRAPAAGIVAELSALAPGVFVRADQRLGAIVAAGELVAEALFEPAEALGRVRPEQPGELALAGFPRAEFGALDVRVLRIASEARDGWIKVELALAEPDRARVPLEHGLPGSVQVEVERASPAELVLRSVGGALGLTER